MNERLIDDLGAWERNELSMAELERNHPGEPVDALVGLHGSLSALATEPVPGEAIVWSRVRERLDVRRPSAVGRLRKAGIAGVAVAVLSASAALAAPGSVQAVIDGVRQGVHAVFGGHETGTAPPETRPASVAPVTRHGHPGPVPGTHPDPTDPPTGNGDGEHTGGDGGSDQGGSGDTNDQGSGGDEQGSGGSDQGGSDQGSGGDTKDSGGGGGDQGGSGQDGGGDTGGSGSTDGQGNQSSGGND